MTPLLEVLAPGLLTTVQDEGRPGMGHLGVPLAGACDRWSSAIANGLLGNDPGAAVLELTLIGPDLRALRDCVVGLAGSDLGAALGPSGRRLEPGRAHRLAAGEIITFPDALAGETGARAYLSVPGGLDVPVVLGSRSTCLVARFGGLEGRALREGDRLGSLRLAEDAPDDTAWPSSPTVRPDVVRVLPGPDPASLEELLATTWTASSMADRMGVRFDGAPVTASPAVGTRRTHGAVPGTIQLPPDGLPIALLADAQPTGGYPVPAVAATVDLPVLGQLRPGQAVRFRLIDQPGARAALETQQTALDDGLARLRDAGTWDELWRSARG